jgi:hypothetical protein
MATTSETPRLCADGSWRVGNEVFQTNAQAWRWLDKQNGEARSRLEDTYDWVSKKLASGE